MLLFSWAWQPPQKEGAFGKKAVATPWVQTCWKTTGVHHQVAKQKKGLWGKGMGATSNVLGLNPPKNVWGSWGLFHFLGVYPPDGCVYNITKTNGNIYGEPQQFQSRNIFFPW